MAEGITRIAVEGFKSIAKRQEIEIAPLTILAGVLVPEALLKRSFTGRPRFATILSR